MSKPINFYEKSREIKKGVFFGYPVEDSAIHAFRITEEEMAPYMSPGLEPMHCMDVLSAILDDRRKQGRCEKTGLKLS